MIDSRHVVESLCPLGVLPRILCRMETGRIVSFHHEYFRKSSSPFLSWCHSINVLTIEMVVPCH